jgi:hypothetical protein
MVKIVSEEPRHEYLVVTVANGYCTTEPNDGSLLDVTTPEDALAYLLGQGWEFQRLDTVGSAQTLVVRRVRTRSQDLTGSPPDVAGSAAAPSAQG